MSASSSSSVTATLSGTPSAAKGTGADIPLARNWFLLSVASLLVAGLFALLLVVGRTPPLNIVITDPGFFQRCLVVHVNLSLLVWFCAFTAGLFCLLPGRNGRTGRGPSAVGFPLALGGVTAMSGSAFLPGTSPILSNYIPFIDHPLFAAGLIAFFAGLTLTYFQGRLWKFPFAGSDGDSGLLPAEAGVGVRFAAIGTLVAVATFFTAWMMTPRTLPAEAYYEFVAWGGGHVLQVANVAAMVSIWLVLLRKLLGRSLLPPRFAFALFSLLLAPHLTSPFLALQGTTTALYNQGASQLMRWGIFPVVTVFLILAVRRLVAHSRRDTGSSAAEPAWVRKACLIGFAISAGMTVTGFLLGAMIRSSTTMIPAHYHASIGAVTVALMAMAFLLLQPLGFRQLSAGFRRLVPWQLAIFGVGQLVFALGFAVGGAYGLGRKVYGSDQQIASAGEYLGLAIMGIGGLLAVAGGVLFLALMLVAWKPIRVPEFFTQAKAHKPA